MPDTRQGLNVNTSQAGDTGKLMALQEAHKPSVMLLMEGSGQFPNQLAIQLDQRQRQHAGYSVFRAFGMMGVHEGELHLHRSPAEVVHHLNLMNAWTKGMWVHIHNEPHFGDLEEVKRFSGWYAELIPAAMKDGHNLCIYNAAAGAFQRGFIDAGGYDEMLHAWAEHAHLTDRGYARIQGGFHSYGHALPCWHTAGRDVNALVNAGAIQPQHWPRAHEIFGGDALGNYLIGREHWFLQRARQIRNDPALRLEMTITECWWDDMPNIRKGFPQVSDRIDALNGRKMRGLPTALGYLGHMFPGWSAEQTVCEIWKWCETVHPDYYRGFCQFTWSENDDWREDFGMQRVEAALKLWTTYLPIVKEPPMAEQWETRTIDTPQATANLRKEASETADILKAVPDGATVDVEVNGRSQPPGSKWAWVQVRYDGAQGWMALTREFGVMFLPPVIVEPPKEDDDTQPPTPPENMYSKAEVDNLLKLRDERIDALGEELEKQRLHNLAYFDAKFETMADQVLVTFYEALRVYLNGRGLIVTPVMTVTQAETVSKPESIEESQSEPESKEEKEDAA